MLVKLTGMETWWRIELFNGVRAVSGAVILTRFYSQKVGSLLAYLALHCRQAHGREALAEQFWPEADPDAGRLNLRVGLAALRRQLEPPGVPRGSILLTDRTTVRLNSERVTTDVAEFQAAIRAAERTTDIVAQLSLWEQAEALAQGELLPGCYDEWALAERTRLNDLRIEVLQRLSAAWEQSGDLHKALDYAHQVLVLNTLHEESHCRLIRLYLAVSQPEAAGRQYRELERLLQETLGATPSAEARTLAQQVASRQVVAPALTPTARSARASARRSAAGGSTSSPAAPKRAPNSCLPALPALLTRFFGREAELEMLQSLLIPTPVALPSLFPLGDTAESTRIVTVTGPGGTGKTRLALEAGQRLKQEFAGSALFVSLSEVTSPTKILDAILTVLPQERNSDRAPFDQAADGLALHPTLLILDNFEQLLSTEAQAVESAAVITRLREECPLLTFLITSRQALNIQGERELALEPLPTPLHPGAPERLLEFAGVQLFVDRAQRARADFQITPRNAATLVALCHRLEGLPLALELAASWARILTPAQMLARLSDRFEMLVSRRRDIPERHRTLRAAIDWSFQLLTPQLQQCFLRLSLLRGGWTLEAAEAICEQPDALNLLYGLCERSLIVSQENGEEIRRFSMLETLREYAAEQMSPAERNTVAAIHARYFAGLVQRAQERYSHPDAGAWMDRLEQDLENLLAALDWTFEGGDPELGVEMVLNLDWFWFTRGFQEERRRCLERVRAGLDDIGEELRPRALLWTGHFLPSSEACPLYERCLQLFRDRNDLEGIAGALYALGTVAAITHDYPEAIRLFTESLTLQQERADKQGANAARAALGSVYREQGDFDAAQALLQQQLQSLESLGNIVGAAKVRVALANIALQQGDFAEAALLLEVSLISYREIGQRWGLADVMRNLGHVCFAQDAYAESEAFLQESLSMFQEIEDRRMTGLLLLDLAEQAWERRVEQQASVLLKEAAATVESVGVGEGVIRLRCLQGLLASASGAEEEARTRFTQALACHPESESCSTRTWYYFYTACFHLAKGETDLAHYALQKALAGAMRMGWKPLQLRLLARVAEWLVLSHRAAEGVVLFHAVSTFAPLLNILPSPREAVYHERIREILSCPVSPDLSANAREEGLPGDLPDAVARGLTMLSSFSEPPGNLKTLR